MRARRWKDTGLKRPGATQSGVSYARERAETDTRSESSTVGVDWVRELEQLENELVEVEVLDARGGALRSTVLGISARSRA